MRKNAGYGLLLLLFLLLARPSLSGAAGAEEGEREKLLEQRKQLEAIVEKLRQEQDSLIFLKTMQASDSKYLVLDLRAAKGQLRYKNRTLKDLHILQREGTPARTQKAVALTKKIEGPRQRYALVFGRSLILQPRGAAPYREDSIPRAVLSKKDFTALYYAVENGAMAYVLL
jgi:hypothetical protein